MSHSPATTLGQSQTRRNSGQGPNFTFYSVLDVFQFNGGDQLITSISCCPVDGRATTKTLEYLSNYYWFPGMKDVVCKYIKSCIKCILFSAPTKRSEKNLHSIEKVPVPFHTIHMDHFGPLPSICNKKKHILAITDGFTKLIKLYPVNATSSKDTSCVL